MRAHGTLYQRDDVATGSLYRNDAYRLDNAKVVPL
jgi:hypothetical protein